MKEDTNDCKVREEGDVEEETVEGRGGGGGGGASGGRGRRGKTKEKTRRKNQQ